MDHPDFRVAGKIFATLGYPDKTRGMVKLSPEDQHYFSKGLSRRIRSGERRLGTPRSHQRSSESREERCSRKAIHAAWRNTAPKRLLVADSPNKIDAKRLPPLESIMKSSCSSQPSHTHATLRIRMQEVRPSLRKNPEVLRQDGQEVPRMRRPGRADDLRARRPVQRLRLVRHRLRQEILFPGILGRRTQDPKKRRTTSRSRIAPRKKARPRKAPPKEAFLQRKRAEGNPTQRFRTTQIRRLAIEKPASCYALTNHGPLITSLFNSRSK